MARFYGKIGYGESVEVTSGVWEDIIVEHTHTGDVLRNSVALQSREKVNDDLSVGNSISIIADNYASEHISAMRYVVWAGSRWKIENIIVERPRLILRLGGVYNGPTP